MSFWGLCPVFVGIILLHSTSSHANSLSGSTGPGYAKQTCVPDPTQQPDDFYCPYTGINSNTPGCLPRIQRCPVNPSSSVCIEPSSGVEPGCDYSSADGGFPVYLYKANLSRRKRFLDNLKRRHEGITYRGFDYEWGGSYENGQELDTLDQPKYKYLNGADGYRRLEKMGYSMCTRQQAYDEMRRWTGDHSYIAIWTNCQDFAKQFSDYLISGACINAGRKRRSRRAASPAPYVCQNYTLQSTADPSKSSANGHYSPAPHRLFLAAIATVVPMLMFSKV